MFSSIFDGTLIPETQCPCLIDSQLSSLPDKLRHKWLVEDVVNLIFSHVYDDPLYHSNTQRELVSTVHVAARAFQEHVDDLHKPYWHRVTKMLENFRVIHEHAQLALSCSRRDPERHKKSYQDYAKSQLNEMQAGDVLVFHGSSSRDAVTFQKDATCVLYESLCIPNRHGTSCLVFTPGMGIEIPPQVFDNGNFLHELALSLSDGKLPTPILLSVGHPVKPKCTLAAEHVDPDEIQSNFWSRSNTWLLIKAAIQLSLDHSPLSRSTYKAFILFLMCNLAQYAANIDIEIIHCILLHSMSTKILRRLRKLGASVPQWLYNTVSEACATVSRTLDQRRREVQATLCTSPSWDPLQLDLIRDIQHTMTLPHIHEHASASHASHDHPLPHTFFLPVCRPRGTLHRFLSHLGKFSCDDDIHVVLHDVEQAVMDDLADWATSVRVTSIEESCEQLAALTYWYHSSALTTYHYDATKQRGRSDPDCQSIMFLTITELWIALDMLVLKEVPILADYSPEVPMNLLCQLLLHDTKSIHHFRRAYQYLSTRHSRARPGWSVFSNEFTKDSFPCRYYNSSPHLQHLTASIQDMLPCDPFHAKAVIFELQSPMFLDKWRSVTSLLHRIGLSTKPDGDTSLDEQGAKLGEGDVPVCDIPTMKPYVLQECRSRSSLLYSACAPQHWDRLYYFLECSPSFGFKPHYKSGMQMEKYVRDTMHTSNEVLAAQADRDHDLSRREFIAFGHVRSGGSLQWLNILQGLRSRTLKFHDKDVYVLLAQATAQVGPLDQTGELLWHQEIQDPSFCHTLLDVLEGLFNEVGAGLLDGPAMATISLLAGVLASSGTLDTSERAIQLLRNVRTKTLEWVHQLLYHSRRSTEDVQGLSLLQEMAMVCRSTFYVGSAATHRLFRSAQDIEAALCCTMLIQTNPQSHSDFPSYSQVLLNRNHHLSLVLEECLRDAIQADVSDLASPKLSNSADARYGSRSNIAIPT